MGQKECKQKKMKSMRIRVPKVGCFLVPLC